MTSHSATANADGWVPAPLPANEEARLDVLSQTRLIDSTPDNVFQELVAQAAALLKVPAAFLTLINNDRIWFLARYGSEAVSVPRNLGLCSYAILDDQGLLILDAETDPLYKNCALVKGEPFVRFYVSVPLLVKGQAIGTLCIMDTKPHETFTPVQFAILQNLATVASGLIAQRIAA